MGQIQWTVIWQLLFLGAAGLLVLWYLTRSREIDKAYFSPQLTKDTCALVLELRRAAELQYFTQQLIDNCDRDAIDPDDFLGFIFYNQEATRHLNYRITEFYGAEGVKEIIEIMLRDVAEPPHPVRKRYHSMLPEVK